MSETISRESEPVKSEKEILWNEKMKEVESWGDALGLKIDESVRETVVAMNLLRLPTSASCEGHLRWGSLAPWVIISAVGEPEDRFVGEKRDFSKSCSKIRDIK